MNRSRVFDRLGAVSYVIWSLLHFQAAWGVYELGTTLSPSMTQGRVYQDAWNLAFFAAVAVTVAVWLNWRGDRWGYWINLAMVSVTDVGFILFVLVPGHAPLILGLLGPVFWVLGAVCTTIGYARTAHA